MCSKAGTCPEAVLAGCVRHCATAYERQSLHNMTGCSKCSCASSVCRVQKFNLSNRRLSLLSVSTAHCQPDLLCVLVLTGRPASCTFTCEHALPVTVQEAGATPAIELAFTIADGLEYIRCAQVCWAVLSCAVCSERLQCRSSSVVSCTAAVEVAHEHYCRVATGCLQDTSFCGGGATAAEHAVLSQHMGTCSVQLVRLPAAGGSLHMLQLPCHLPGKA